MTWWHFPHYWSFLRGKQQSPVDPPHPHTQATNDAMAHMWLHCNSCVGTNLSQHKICPVNMCAGFLLGDNIIYTFAQFTTCHYHCGSNYKKATVPLPLDYQSRSHDHIILATPKPVSLNNTLSFLLSGCDKQRYVQLEPHLLKKIEL